MPNITVKEWVLASLAMITILIVWSFSPLSQDPAYHVFADRREFFGLPNGLNVLSNFPFVLAGATGLFFSGRLLLEHGPDWVLMEYFLFFIGTAGIGAGSMYYHYNPVNSTLFWDRLPMSVSFMSFFSSVLSERVSRKAGVVLFLPLVVLGAGSTAYWAWSESLGSGDLRPYAVVQFVPVVLIAAVLVLYRSPRSYWQPVSLLLAFYGAAKAFEALDHQIFAAGQMVSGHTLKHLFASAGIFFIINMLRKREHPRTDQAG